VAAALLVVVGLTEHPVVEIDERVSRDEREASSSNASVRVTPGERLEQFD